MSQRYLPASLSSTLSFLAAVYVSVVDHRGLYFWFQLERHWPWGGYPPPTLPGNPLISILILL
nr:Poly-beta-1,6-N-acetyl-D-glucosamine synthase [Klebsiella pneumoniae]